MMLSRREWRMAFVSAFLATVIWVVWCSYTESSVGWWVGGARTTMEHRDESRGAVGWTAFLVSLLRAVESSRAVDPLLRDPVAEKLFSVRSGAAPLSARLAFLALCRIPILQRVQWIQRTQAIVSLRTHFLDDQIAEALSQTTRNQNDITSKAGEREVQQLVIMGAGLDSRAFRLSSLFQNTDTKVFEMDLPGMLAEKCRLFAASGFHYENVPTIHVGVDLSGTGWDIKLLEKDFDKSLRTVWLLEGFSAYFTEKELESILWTISELSAPTSRILATWIATPQNVPTVSMHKAFVAKPTELLARFGYTLKVQEQPLSLTSKLLGRFENIATQDYILTSHEKPTTRDDFDKKGDGSA